MTFQAKEDSFNLSETNHRWFDLFLLLAATFVVGAAGSMLTFPSVNTWYQGIERPSFTPPDWVFGPVWTSLYILMAAAAWLVFQTGRWRRVSRAMRLFFIQLVLNVLWSGLFFTLQQPALAFVEIVILWLLIFETMRAFWNLRPLAGILMVPYWLWVSYAAVLNFSIAWLNA